jgi:hypothetical protein
MMYETVGCSITHILGNNNFLFSEISLHRLRNCPDVEYFQGINSEEHIFGQYCPFIGLCHEIDWARARLHGVDLFCFWDKTSLYELH